MIGQDGICWKLTWKSLSNFYLMKVNHGLLTNTKSIYSALSIRGALRIYHITAFSFFLFKLFMMLSLFQKTLADILGTWNSFISITFQYCTIVKPKALLCLLRHIVHHFPDTFVKPHMMYLHVIFCCDSIKGWINFFITAKWNYDEIKVRLINWDKWTRIKQSRH